MAESHLTRCESLDVVDRLSIRLLAVRYVRIDEGWDTRDVLDSFWRLYVNNRDGAQVVQHDADHHIVANRVHLVPAWTPFSCRCDRAIDHFYVHFDVADLPGALSRQVFDRPAMLDRDGDLVPRAAAIAPRFDGKSSPTLSDMLTAKALVCDALGRLLDELPSPRVDRLSRLLRGPHAVSPALDHIEEHLSDPLHNADLAALCHLSPDHFARRFRQIVGQTPRQFITERRIARAAQQLLFTPDSIETIAADAGFPNRFYFSRVFARQMGQPPAAYRRSARV